MRRTAVTQQLAPAIRTIVPDAEIILFGSEARGDARADSDIDLMILLDQPKVTFAQQDKIYTPIYDISLQHNVIINALIYTKSYWNNRPMDWFKYNVQQEGIQL